MEEFLASLALAAVSAVAFLAYKHPVAYRKLYDILFVLLPVSIILAVGWDFAVSVARRSIAGKMPPEVGFSDPVSNAIRTGAAEVQILNKWVWLGYVAVTIYLTALKLLPLLLDEQKPPQPPKPKGNKKGQ